ncbi:urea transporter [Burkholderia multivorans]|uniref:urea transporter n=1 Tax=Burkholderia multivorans TaxID=87883 RepID=UPI0009E0C729|nr:urea transporter [Burkholderia multivorans]MCA8502771.1 urea transporter [Burkholderia multivorans]MDN8081224.1 urea transporter [Burkholderia multivorans]SAJ88901.1 Urea transporter [Burkholderia multivorans]SAJ88902.1 Urea transporter [Burkholderia multivorans]
MFTAHSATPSIDLRILLRSIGQIVLQANALTGALLLAALALTDPRLACAALLGAPAANLTAVLTGARRDDLEQGLHGFNGALAALVAAVFTPDPLLGVALSPLPAIGAALVHRAMRGPLAKWRQCPYSSPCLAVSALWLPFFIATQHPDGAIGGAAPTWSAIGPALLAGVAQTTFAQGAWAGALIVAGIAAESRRAAAFALAGAVVSTVLLTALGADAASLTNGLLGFNGALAALALLPRGTRAALAAAALAALIQWLAMRAGLAALTAPFALASWIAVAVARRFTLGEADVVIRTPS